MFNQDNYHWTQDDYTAEGINLLKEHLKSKGITFTEDPSTIYLTQRMGRKSYRLDISGVLQKDSTKLYIVGYTGISSDEVEESPLKEIFITSVKEVIEELQKKQAETKTEIHQISQVNTDTSKSKPIESEELKKEIGFKGPVQHISSILFNKEIVPVISPEVSFVSCPGKVLEILPSEVKEDGEGLKRECTVHMEGKTFTLQFIFKERMQGSVLRISGAVPVGFCDKFISYYENLVIDRLKRANLIG
ncbi:hypothetical protein NEIRO03_1095 [Nematocida sp. AWRm78]|nr:hypothetical protein NEIRO02_1318 [Nematocida sp. AWRm79]KAI5183505.1 hypothetical protein NEIRO03_1095 [Nematocida sp. AWRm78]